ncbi:autotransporter outer membrane beta-barrel domain-containing protein [Yersinia aldovae]|uniref:autotransporter outer membrane beta-barrel domain-containing protein n=1 Tax=Yersinia aldovae TaxID=29483 RepID=UPI0005AC30FE|nr:autotransporter outer membrane beta-barrel domain-containing protein [Yersinia aldovae]AJJ63777.1 outer membrane autotransporter barrel domain protein [Yersinia aldovae 670-83]
MNKTYQIIWNANTQQWIVASELAGGKKKSKSSKLAKFCHSLIISGSLSLTGAASADALEVAKFSPKDGGQSQVVIGVDVLTQGSGNGFADIIKGDIGYRTMTLSYALANGYITSGAEYISQDMLKFGAQTQNVSYTDPITHSQQTVATYNNNAMSISSAADFAFPNNYAIGPDGQYVDRTLYTVQQGGNLSVDVGSVDSNWMNNQANQITAIMKGSQNNTATSAVFKVATDASSVANATLDYISKTVVELGNVNNNAYNADSAGNLTPRYAAAFNAGYAGTVQNSQIGYTEPINNFDDFKNYNTALIAAVQAGKLTQTQYNTEFKKGYDTTLKQVFATAIIPDDDAMKSIVNRDRVAYIIGDGNKSIVNIATSANIHSYYSDISLVKLINGAVLNNNGTLGTFNNTLRGAYIVATTDSIVINNGVIDAGTDSEMAAFSKYTLAGSYNISTGNQTGIMANGSSVVDNNGVINSAPRQNNAESIAVNLNGTAKLTNNGAINVAALPESGAVNGEFATRGVIVQSNAQFDNKGTLYVGRMAQRATTDATTDIAVTYPNTVAVWLANNGKFTNQNGAELVIGSLAQGVTGVYANGANTVLNQLGVINVNGQAGKGTTTAPLQNIAINSANGSKNIVNNGTINLNGINGVGIKVLASSAATNSATGVININGASDRINGTANYGIWSEGAGATANLSGKVNLNGDSSVGVHVRNQGKVNVSNAGEVLFTSGKNQTGYYVYGAGSSINNQTTGAQNVATEGSTLYRIDGGASFNGGSTQSLINADGKNSTALLVTGKSDTGNIASTLSTGSMKLNVNGTGATGVKVEGGANGTINAETTLILNGSQTTAGIVDGNSTSIIGTAGVVGLSTLTSLATLTSGNTASDAMGYIARNGGKLIHNGTLNFDQANSTGVLISGGTLENNSGISVNGTAVNIQGKNSKVTNTGTVAATDGTAAYLVGANASLALDGKGTTTASGTAHGILLDSGAVGLTVNDAIISVNGSGNGIENKANIAGIQLNATTLDAGSGAGVRTGASMATTNSGTINVNGKGGTGILFANTDLSMTSSILDMSKSQQLIINVAGENGIGIDSRSTGDIKTGASVNVNALNGGPALKIGGTSSSVEQSGNLVSKSTQSPVVDISSGYVTTFINSGKIQAATTSQSAVQNSANNGVAFTNDAGGVISGKVNLLSGNNTVTLMSSSQGTDFITGSGDDTFILKDITATDSALFTSLQGGAGTDSLILDNSLWTLSDATSLQQIDKIKLINNSTFTLDNTLLALGDAADDNASTGFNIESGSRLNVRNNQAVSFNNKLLGTGLVDVDTTGNAFDFTTNAASNTFTGTLALGNSRYALSGLNTQALTTATLQLNQGSYTKVGTGKQTIGGLAFNGGTIDFGNISPGDKTAVNNIHTRQNMDLSGNGVVQVTLSNMINYNPTPDTKLSLLAQDDAQTILKLADSDTTVVGSGGNLVLEDQHGTAISNKTVLGIDQDGSTVANGTWDYRLTAGDKSDGLYINYGLTEVELLGKGNQALSLSTEGATGAASDLSAHVTGSGDLLIDTGKGNTLSLSNLDNDYLGNTTVSSGTLAMHNNNVLGQTDSLTLAADAGLDMMGHSQTINTLQNELGGNLSFNDGSLTLHQGGNSDGILSGSGSLNVNAGALNINNANNTLAVTTTIANAASVLLTNVSGLGRGVIDNAGLLTLQGNTGTLLNALSNNGKVALTQSSQVALSADSSTFSGTFSLDKGTQLAANAANQLGISVIENDGVLAITANNDWQLDNDVTGSGAVTKQGDETLTVNNNARWTGATDILAGGLLLGDGIQPVTLSSQQVNIAQNAFMAGNGGVAGNVNNQGTLYVGAQPNSNIVLRATSSPATFTVGGDLSNDGKIVLAGNTLGNQLIVNNNYTGNNGHLSFNTVLGGDDSLTDHLLIKGDSAGTTTVSVNNVGGTGAATLNGIELIHVNGQSDGDFIQESRIVAGAYDYVLSRGTAENSGNWYLDNFGSGSTPISYPIPVDPDVTPNAAPTVRPEAGSYVSNIAAANTLFTNRLHDRLGETQYIDVLSGEKKVTSMWMRNVGGHTGWKDGSGQLNSQSNRYVMQIGGDLAQWSLDGLDRWHLGSMAGYANQHSNTQSNRSTHQSEGDISGYSIGVYGTWYANDSDKTGIYIDSWVQYNWFDNTVKGQELADESYKSKGTTASLETGYTFKTGEKPGTRYYLQPKVQATWMGVKADNHQEANGTNVSSDGNGNLMTRLGVRAFMNGHHSKDDGKDREFEPFIEANWIHNTKNFSTNMDGATVSQQGTKNIAEIKVGVEGQINKQLNTWGNVGVQVGDAGYNDTAAMIGVKYNF